MTYRGLELSHSASAHSNEGWNQRPPPTTVVSVSVMMQDVSKMGAHINRKANGRQMGQKESNGQHNIRDDAREEVVVWHNKYIVSVGSKGVWVRPVPLSLSETL